MPTTPSKQVFEGVFIPPSRTSSTLTRSTSKRAAPATSIEVTPSAKRVRTSADGSASNESHTGVRTSSRTATVVSSTGSRSSRTKAEPRRTPTRIDVPKRGDRNGPAIDLRGSSAPRTRVYSSYQGDSSSSDGDEIAIPVSKSTRKRELEAATRNGSTRASTSTSSSVRARLPGLPGQRTSSRKRAAISDLMSRKMHVNPEDQEEEPEAIVVVGAEAGPSRETCFKPQSFIEADRGAAHRSAEPEVRAMHLDDSQEDISLSLGSTRDASPEAASPNERAATMTTPSKHRTASTHLSTPTLSAKRRTPTKATKEDEKALPAFLVPALQRASAGPADIRERPASPAVPLLPERLHSREEVVRVLHEVLERLSGPTHTLPSADPPEPSDPAFRTWLDQLPCLSEGHIAAERDVRNMLNRTIREGEGNCLLLVGERGIGKTAVIDRSLEVLGKAYGKDGFLVVRLSGLVQRDDKSALKEVARQLCSSAFVEEADTDGTSSFVSASFLSRNLCQLTAPADIECQYTVIPSGDSGAWPLG